MCIRDRGLAADAARRLMATGAKSQSAYIAQVAHLAQAQDYEGILALRKAGHSAGALLDDMLSAWANLGLGLSLIHI